MTKLFGFVSLPALATVLLAAGCQSAQSPSPSVSTATTQPIAGDSVAGTSATLIVHGMSCPLCAHNVDKQLLAVPGVTGVRLDMGTGEAFLSLDGTGRTTRQMLADAIDRSGFTLQEVRVP
jgi:copper chaperone CopZ